MTAPAVNLSDCIKCGICVDLCPSVFSFSPSGYVDVAELSSYPAGDVDEAIKNCPSNCIEWVA